MSFIFCFWDNSLTEYFMHIPGALSDDIAQLICYSHLYSMTKFSINCISCGVCVKACRQEALKMVDGKVELDAEKCNHCGRCVKSCPVDAWEGTPGYIVSFGGTFGNNIYKGEELLPLIPDKETLFRVTDAAITFFEKNANPSERFRKTLQRVGEEDFRKQLKEAYEGQ